MPAPATVDEFVDLIRKSAVVDDGRLAAYVQKFRADPTSPKDLSSVAGLFVRDGLLTFFQAEQFLQGKWKRFTIGKYKVLERLGSGGMGQVFLCEHKLMRRRVAVKVLPTQKATDPSSLDRFYREARAVAALDHPNIVRAYDIDQDDNLHFLVMEYVDGASLQEMVRKSGPLDPTRACHYMYWSAVGLQHAHQQGLIHRDIKPGNILVDRQGVVKILDLGLARFFHDEDDLLTKKYDESVLGTADYLAPEQAVDSHTVDGRADIYSLGATFYFLLTGQPPFAEGTVAQKLLWHQSKTPRPVREARPEVPEAVADVVAKMMAKQPDERYQSPGELAEALLPFIQTPIPPPPDSEMPTLSAAAQAAGSSPPSMAVNAPRTLVGGGPRTPPPAPAPPRAPGSGGPKPRAPKPANVALADADTQKNKPVPTIEPIPNTPIPNSSLGGGIWESISAETANNSRADTDRTKRDGSSRRVKAAQKSTAKAPAAKSGRLARKRRLTTPIVLAVVGGLILLGAGIALAAFLLGSKDKTTKPGTNGTGAPRTLVVARNAAGALQFPTVDKAIADFKPGDTIVLQDDVEESVVASKVKNLKIVAADGKKVTWRAPAKGGQNYLLSLFAAEGGYVAGITFEGGPNVDHAVRLSGPCAGLVLENDEFLNAKESSLCLVDCTGDAKGQVVIRKCRVAGPASKAGIQFNSEVASRPGAPGPGRPSVVIQNCLVEGPAGGAAIQFDGSASCEIRNCRIFQGAFGARFHKVLERPASDVLWQVNLVGNTFHSQSAAGLWVEDAGQVKSKPANKITLAYNFFAEGGPPAIKVDGDAANQKFLVVDPNNVRKKGTPPVQPDNFQPPPQLAETDADVMVDPANPARNLTYDKNSPLFKAAGGKPVGAPPE